MEELINKNNQIIKEVVETLPNIQQSIDDVNKNYQYYIGSIKNEVFRIKPDETYEQAIKRGEGIFDRIDETERRRKLVIEKGQKTINQIEIMKNKMEKIIEECNNDEEIINKAKDELIDKIISIELMSTKDEIKPLVEEINKIKRRFNKKKEEWEKHYSDYEERKKKREEYEEKERRKEEEEMRKLEEWTNRKVGNILFDSNKDDWKVNTSVFDQRIMNKEHIIIIIEDTEGNKFGGYVNSKIDKVSYYDYINDSKSFVFSLESNRIERMMKFDIRQPQYAFILFNQSDNRLFGFGNGSDICVYKDNYKTYSLCKQSLFEYYGIGNALCGKYNFTPKRIIVIEMK
ncbi:predicted protein [Entamoeba histolytica]